MLDTSLIRLAKILLKWRCGRLIYMYLLFSLFCLLVLAPVCLTNNIEEATEYNTMYCRIKINCTPVISLMFL